MSDLLTHAKRQDLTNATGLSICFCCFTDALTHLTHTISISLSLSLSPRAREIATTNECFGKHASVRQCVRTTYDYIN